MKIPLSSQSVEQNCTAISLLKPHTPKPVTTLSLVISQEEVNERTGNQRSQLLHHRSSPVEKIPAEVLGEILLHAVTSWTEGHATREQNPDFNAPSALWKASKVCRFWRNVALSLPALWSTIVILPPASKPTFTGSLFLIETQLERSAGAPLSIHLGGFSEACDYDRPTLYAIIETLINHSYRWRSIHLFRMESDLVWRFRAIKGHVPILESVHLNLLGSQWSCRGSHIGDFDGFALCPSLVDFKSNFVGHAPDIPWSTLTSYSGLADVPEQLRVVSRSLSLSRLELTSSGGWSYYFSPRIVLPCLHTLHLRGGLGTLESIAAPMLRNLILNVRLPRHTDKQCLSSFIRRSSFTLSSLTITTRTLSAPNFAEILHDLPHLTSLHIEIDELEADPTDARPLTDENNGQLILLLSLETLSLRRSFSILNYITSPKLRDLRLAGRLSSLLSLHSFIQRSSFSLRRLDVAEMDTPDLEIISILNVLPSSPPPSLHTKSTLHTGDRFRYPTAPRPFQS